MAASNSMSEVETWTEVVSLIFDYTVNRRAMKETREFFSAVIDHETQSNLNTLYEYRNQNLSAVRDATARILP